MAARRQTDEQTKKQTNKQTNLTHATWPKKQPEEEEEEEEEDDDDDVSTKQMTAPLSPKRAEEEKKLAPLRASARPAAHFRPAQIGPREEWRRAASSSGGRACERERESRMGSRACSLRPRDHLECARLSKVWPTSGVTTRLARVAPFCSLGARLRHWREKRRAREGAKSGREREKKEKH